MSKCVSSNAVEWTSSLVGKMHMEISARYDAKYLNMISCKIAKKISNLIVSLKMSALIILAPRPLTAPMGRLLLLAPRPLTAPMGRTLLLLLAPRPLTAPMGRHSLALSGLDVNDGRGTFPRALASSAAKIEIANSQPCIINQKSEAGI